MRAQRGTVSSEVWEDSNNKRQTPPSTSVLRSSLSPEELLQQWHDKRASLDFLPPQPVLALLLLGHRLQKHLPRCLAWRLSPLQRVRFTTTSPATNRVRHSAVDGMIDWQGTTSAAHPWWVWKMFDTDGRYQEMSGHNFPQNQSDLLIPTCCWTPKMWPLSERWEPVWAVARAPAFAVRREKEHSKDIWN